MKDLTLLSLKSALTAGIGIGIDTDIELWRNKFGCNNSTSFVKNSCQASTPLLVEYQL